MRLSADLMRKAQALADPVLFAKEYLNFDCRWYQAEILRTKHRRKLLRCGRRCLTPDTLVLMEDNYWKEIQHIVPGESVVSYENGLAVVHRVADHWINGEHQTYRVHFADDSHVDCTANHPLLIQRDERCWISIDDGLCVGDIAFCFDGDFRQVEIVAIEPLGRSLTYDIEVEGAHNFIANGIVVHNTGKTTTSCVYMLWYAFTHKKSVCLVATPYESQVHMIFQIIRELVSNSDAVQSSIVVDNRHPEQIEFSNGSQIKGFTMGTKSGSEGGSARGQRADVIMLDEMDFMNDADINSVYAIAIERENIEVIASSTPTGKRGLFWRWYLNANHPELSERDWLEFYFPSTVIPGWNEKMERDFRTSLTEDGYIHEVLAQFGEEERGVFNKTQIDRALRDYEYVKMGMEPRFRVLGVDWDKYQSTPTLVMLEFDPYEANDSGEKGMFKVVLRDEIPKVEFTLDYAVQRVVELNALFRPTHVYVDRGYGEYQLEQIRKMGQSAAGNPNHPAYGLDTKTKGIAFSQRFDVLDPVTGEIDRKDAKPFMINQLQLMFERDKIRITAKDTKLIEQLQDYRVESVSVLGRPKYVNKNEHMIDAMALCVLAFTLEMPELAKTIYKPTTNTKFGFTRELPVPPLVLKPLDGPRGKTREEEAFDPANGNGSWMRVDQHPSGHIRPKRAPWGGRGAMGNKNPTRKSF
jgi:hypothetical protein